MTSLLSSEPRSGRRPRTNLRQTLSDGPADRPSVVGHCVCGFISVPCIPLEEFCGLRTSGSAHSWDSPLRSHGHSGGNSPPQSLFFLSCLAALGVFVDIFVLVWYLGQTVSIRTVGGVSCGYQECAVINVRLHVWD